VHFQENCKTADFELCKKGGAQFCRPETFNLYFLYRLKKIWCEFSKRVALNILEGVTGADWGLRGNRYIKTSEKLRKKRKKSRVSGPTEPHHFKSGSFPLKIYLKSLNFSEKVLKKN
jgi:hypothetical protein